MVKVSPIDEAVKATKEEDFLRALNLFLDIYGTEDAPPIRTPRDASALSYFGLCLALVKKQFKTSIELCRRAADLEFYNGDHYANLARVYLAAGNRKKAVDTAEQGLKLVPEHDYLLAVRASLGVRTKPAVPFLERSNPINVSLGHARAAKTDPARKKR